MSEVQLYLTLDTNSEVPYHQQIRLQVEEAILREDVRPGDRLPAAPDLAEALGVGQATASRAYRDLQVLGVVESFRGRGVMLCEDGRDILLKRRRRTVGPLGVHEASSTVSPLDHGPGARPLHTQIRETIQRDIASGVLRAGDILPPMVMLARRFKVNNNTVGRAINDLKLLGVLTAHGSRGVSVAFPGEADAEEPVEEAPEVKAPEVMWRPAPDETPGYRDTVTVAAVEPQSFIEYADDEFTYFDPKADYTPEDPDYGDVEEEQEQEEQVDDGADGEDRDVAGEAVDDEADDELTYFDPDESYEPEPEAETGEEDESAEADDGLTYFDPDESYEPEPEPETGEEAEAAEEDDGLTYFDPNETYEPEDTDTSPGDEARGSYGA